MGNQITLDVGIFLSELGLRGREEGGRRHRGLNERRESPISN